MIGARSDCNNHSHHREHWVRKRGKWKPKHAFSSVADAEEFIIKHKMDGYAAYTCSICGRIHIGKKT